jgi:hypothetical protein
MRHFIVPELFSEAVQKRIRASCLQNNLIDKGKKPKGLHMQRFYLHYQQLLQENPYGPANLFSSSCLKTFRDLGGAMCVAHTDFSCTVQLRRLKRTSAPYPLRHGLHKDRRERRELIDYNLSEEERAYGLALVNDPLLFAVRYRRAISIIDVDGDVKGSWKSDHDLSDVAVMPWLDSFVSVAVSGTIRSINYDTEEVVGVWENAVAEHVDGYKWACLEGGKDDETAKFRVGTRKAVLIFDTRRGSVAATLCRSLCNEPLYEVITALASSAYGGGKHFYCATSQGVHLMDERSLSNPVVTWRHLSEAEMVVGCQTLSVDGIEYVVTHAGNGDVQILANDWNHSPCKQTSQISERWTSSCKDWTRAEFPLTRGNVAQVPSLLSIRNEFPFASDIPVSHLTVPWVGMTMISENPRELSLFGLSAAGTIYSCDVGLNHQDEEGERDNATSDLFDSEDILEDSPARKKVTSSWDVSKDWATSPIENAWLDKWDRSCHKNSYLKIPRVVAKYIRHKDEDKVKRAAGTAYVHPIRKSKGAKVTKHHPDVSDSQSRTKQVIPRSLTFKACPLLPAIDSTMYTDPQGDRVATIFNDGNPFPDAADISDSDSLHSYGERSKNSRSSTTGTGPGSTSVLTDISMMDEDRGPDLNQFLRDIEANGMTSTQEQAEEMPLLASQSVLDSQPASQSQQPKSAKKTKSRKTVGF